MTAAFTICLPHKRNAGNNRALSICLDMLQANTVNDFCLAMDSAADGNLYERVNQLVAFAATDICIYFASDIFAAPAWDVPIMEMITPHRFVTNILIEPGAIAMSGMNVQRDFGRKPETFRRAEFEQWAMTDAQSLDVRGEGWPCPYAFYRDMWLGVGGLETGLYSPDGFTDADARLWDRWKNDGREIVRAKSFCYHLQRFSDENEQVKAGR